MSTSVFGLVITLVAAVVFTGVAIAEWPVITPETISDLTAGYRVECWERLNSVHFAVFISGDTYKLMQFSRGRLEIEDLGVTIVDTPVLPSTRDGEVVWGFEVGRKYLSGATFSLSAGHQCRLLLEDWSTEGAGFSYEFSIRETEVVRGDTVYVDLVFESDIFTSLSFGSTCQLGVALHHANGELAYRPEGACGATPTRIVFEPNKAKSFVFSVPTFYGEDVESELLEGGYLPLGRYSMVCYLLGYREIGLREYFDIVVVEQ